MDDPAPGHRPALAVIVPFIFTAGFIGGALWGIIPAILKIEYAIIVVWLGAAYKRGRDKGLKI